MLTMHSELQYFITMYVRLSSTVLQLQEHRNQERTARILSAQGEEMLGFIVSKGHVVITLSMEIFMRLADHRRRKQLFIKDHG